MVEAVKGAHQQMNNPLGLEDAFTTRILYFQASEFPGLDEWYQMLSAIHRYRLGTNQLEFLWDGSDQLTRYRSEWSRQFREWINAFCGDPLFVQAVLDLTVFLSPDANPEMASARMQHFMLKSLGMRLHRTRGLVAA